MIKNISGQFFLTKSDDETEGSVYLAEMLRPTSSELHAKNATSGSINFVVIAKKVKFQ